MDSRYAWKKNIKEKLRSKGHEITPWLDKHIDYLALLSADQYQAEIDRFNRENQLEGAPNDLSQENV